METGGVKRLAAQPQVSSRQMKANRHYTTSNQLAFRGGVYCHCNWASPKMMTDRRALNATGCTIGSSEKQARNGRINKAMVQMYTVRVSRRRRLHGQNFTMGRRENCVCC
jgi:hypothetical protein